MERSYEPYQLQGGDAPHACKDMSDAQPLKCCDNTTVCNNQAGLPCLMQSAAGYTSLLQTVVDAALQQQQDKNVSLIPCIGASTSNADCALADDSMLAASLEKLPPHSPVCFYMGGV